MNDRLMIAAMQMPHYAGGTREEQADEALLDADALLAAAGEKEPVSIVDQPVSRVEYDRQVARAEAAEAKAAALEKDCSAISAELGLPPGIRPADGEIRRIMDRAEAAEAASEWRPIGTAPHSTMVLIGWQDTTSVAVGSRFYTEVYWQGDAANRFNREPTHWMPLPAAPEGKKP